MAQTRMLFILAALASGVFTTPVQAQDGPSDATVVMRRVEVPQPRDGNLRINTPQRLAPSTIIVRPGQGDAQRTQPVSGAAISAPAPSFSLEQPGLPPGALEAASQSAALPVNPASASGVAPSEAGLPPPPVFQTMQQAASALPEDKQPVASAIPLVSPEPPDTSLKAQALALMMAYPMALPGCAIFLVFLAFLSKRSRAKNRDDEAGH